MKPWIRWTLGVLIVAVAGAVVLRMVSQRKAQQAAATAQAQASRAAPVLELAPSDVVEAQARELSSGLALTGSLRSIHSAFVKARVAGELQGLTLREGDSVRAGQLVARIDPTEYAARVQQAEQQAESARAQVDIAQRQFDNNKALVDQGFISRTALDTSLASLQAARANHQAALAAVEVARKAVADTELRAPIGGQVAQRLAQPGERMPVDGRVIEIVDPSRLELEAAISPADSVGVRVGQTATLRIEGLADAVPARVARINPSTQAGSRSVLVYLQVAPQPGLRQGLFAQGTLGTQRISVLAVPLDAVRTDKPEPYVQVVQDGRVAHRPVKTGARGDVDGRTWVGVIGLAEGTAVIAGSAGALREGTEVRIGAASPARPASASPGASAAASR